MAGRLELTWDDGGRLTVRGSGFAPRERIALTVAVHSRGATTVTSGGSVVQSSGSSSQSSTVTLGADAAGTFRFESTIITGADAEVAVTASGDRGTHAEARTTRSATRS